VSYFVGFAVGVSVVRRAGVATKQLYNAQHSDQIRQQAIESKLLQPIAQYDKEKNCAIDQHTPTTYKTYLTHFACGHVSILSNGTTIRHFTLIVDDNHKAGTNITITKQGLQFPAWTFNGTVPGPTLRMTQGNHVIVDVDVINNKRSGLIHSWHVHSIHSGANDGQWSILYIKNVSVLIIRKLDEQDIYTSYINFILVSPPPFAHFYL
jgi:hypothetical protein